MTAQRIDRNSPVLLTMTTDTLADLVRILDHVACGVTNADDVSLAYNLLTHDSIQVIAPAS